MKLGLILPSAAACLLVAGCATNREDGTAERAGKGAAVGAAVGAAAGALIGVGPVQGAVAGAVVGGVAKAAARKNRRYFRDENGECYYLTKGGGRVYDPAGCATVIER